MVTSLFLENKWEVKYFNTLKFGTREKKTQYIELQNY